MIGLLLYLFVANKVCFFTVLIAVIFIYTSFSFFVPNLKNHENKRIAQIAHSGDALLAYLDDSGHSGGSSISARKELMKNGLDALGETYGLGVGGGGSLVVQEKLGGVNGKYTSMHNFWIELMVEGGLLFFPFFVIWYSLVSLKLYLIFKGAKEEFYRYHAGALFVSFVIFSIGCISASSVIYILPMWLMFGLAISLISLNDQKNKSVSKVNDESCPAV